MLFNEANRIEHTHLGLLLIPYSSNPFYADFRRNVTEYLSFQPTIMESFLHLRITTLLFISFAIHGSLANANRNSSGKTIIIF